MGRKNGENFVTPLPQRAFIFLCAYGPWTTLESMILFNYFFIFFLFYFFILTNIFTTHCKRIAIYNTLWHICHTILDRIGGAYNGVYGVGLPCPTILPQCPRHGQPIASTHHDHIVSHIVKRKGGVLSPPQFNYIIGAYLIFARVTMVCLIPLYSFNSLTVADIV